MTVLVRQREAMDCGRACVAMFASVSYERTMESTAPDVAFKGMSYGEIIGAVWKITGLWPRLTIKRAVETVGEYLRRVVVRKAEIVLCIRPEIADAAARHHFVVIDNEEGVFDPLESRRLTRSEVIAGRHAGWQVVGVIR